MSFYIKISYYFYFFLIFWRQKWYFEQIIIYIIIFQRIYYQSNFLHGKFNTSYHNKKINHHKIESNRFLFCIRRKHQKSHRYLGSDDHYEWDLNKVVSWPVLCKLHQSTNVFNHCEWLSYSWLLCTWYFDWWLHSQKHSFIVDHIKWYKKVKISILFYLRLNRLLFVIVLIIVLQNIWYFVHILIFYMTIATFILSIQFKFNTSYYQK